MLSVTRSAGQDGGAHLGKLTARLDAQAKAGAELVERGHARGIAGRGDHGRRAENVRDRPGERVAATRVRPRDRNRERERLVHAHHAGIGAPSM